MSHTHPMPAPPLCLHERFFDILYRMVRHQNERLLREIAVRERGVHPAELMDRFLPSRKALREFLRHGGSGAPVSPDAK